MKKVLLFVIAIMFATFSVNAQTASDSTALADSTIKVEVPTTASEVERLIDKYGGKIIDGFNSVVEKATPYAKDGFRIAVKLQIAKGIAGLLPLIMAIVFMVSAFKLNKSAIWDREGLKNPAAVLVVICSVISAILFVAALFCTYNAVLYLIAPEWFAVQDIINLLK